MSSDATAPYAQRHRWHASSSLMARLHPCVAECITDYLNIFDIEMLRRAAPWVSRMFLSPLALPTVRAALAGCDLRDLPHIAIRIPSECVRQLGRGARGRILDKIDDGLLSRVHTLQLEFPVSESGARNLLSAIRKSTSIRTLTLPYNVATKRLCTFLRRNRTVTSLNFLHHVKPHHVKPHDVKPGVTGHNATPMDVKVAKAIVKAAKRTGVINTLCGINNGQTALYLSQRNLLSFGAVLLAFDLEFNNALKNLKNANLAANDIGNEGAIAISSALESNTTLTDLNLQARQYGSNVVRISVTGAQAIAKMLAVNRALKSADFSANSIGDEGTAALSDALKTNSTLETLELRRNEVGAAGAQSLADMLQVNRALTSVNLLQNDLDDGVTAIVAAAKQQGHIKTLCGIKNGQTEADFSECWRTKMLQASDAVLLSFDVEFNRSLNTLDLSDNNIAGISRIKKDKLQGTSFKKGETVQYNGQQCIVYQEDSDGDLWVQNMCGVIALAEALKFNRALTSLDLNNNGIGAGGAKAIAAALPQSALTSVNLLYNGLGDGAAAVVAAAKQQGKIKTLCGISSGQAEVDLSWNTTHKSLRAPDAVLLSFDLEFNRALKSADLGGNSIGDEGTAALSEALKSNSTLEELELWNNHIGAVGAQSLADMLQFNRALNSINLLNNDLGEGAAAVVAAAKQNSNIKTLCGIEEGEDKVSFFNNGLKAPDAVLLSFDLEFNRALTSVNLLQNDLGDGAAAIVAAAKQQGKIKTLCGIKEGQSEFEHYGPNNGFLEASDAVLLSFDLEFNRALTSVNLLKNDLGDGAAAVVAAAKQHGKIKTLCGIAGGKIEVSFYEQSLKAPDAVLLSFDLEFNRSLTSLDLSANRIGAGGAKAIAAVLPQSALKSAYLGNNSIGDEGTAALSEALKANSNLEELELWNNEIGVAGAQSLANMLQFNRALKSANLGRNSIGDEGTSALSGALKSNSTLEKLNLAGNEFGAAGAQSLADMLQFNRALNSVDLRYNSIPDEGCRQLRAAVGNKSIKLQLEPQQL